MDTNIPEIEDAPSSLKSVVWKHFGLAVNYTNSGQRVVNRRKAVCRLCFTEVGCLTGSTSNLMSHLLRHHPFLSFENTPSQHRKPLSAYKQPLAAGSDRAAAITDAIGVFIAADMRPCSVVENTGFKHLLNVLDPRYKVPTREHFSSAVVPALYKQTRAVVIYELSAAPSVALTVEEWTLRATESYLTVTAHYISPDWEMKSPVLQTRPVYEHKSTNYAEKLKEVVADWSLERPRCTIPVTSDNAKNIVSAVLEAGLGPQIDCFAHTINLAAQKATAVSQVSRLLGKIRRLASFFHRSTAAAHILLTKQEMLEVSKQPLVHDVPSRWISSFDMVERYIEQQVAVHSALTEKAIKNKDIVSLTDKEMAVAEGVIEVLKPLRIIATIITESTPSVSMILPLKTRILKSMERDDGDSATVREMKAVITGNLQDRYSGDDLQEFLHKCTALDPRFKSLPHVDRACRQRIYDTLTKEIMANIEQDNAPCHTARSIKVWMKDHQIKTLSWTDQSPDLNPIEILWNVIKRKMDGHKPSNKAKLLECLHQQCHKFTQQQCERLVESMPRCMKTTIENQGFSTKYCFLNIIIVLFKNKYELVFFALFEV
ncbi:E3 SUMO-protein ligase ZBED1 isoform X3 [Myxocyprinus asiaticus]|uniref:E3 SUMO-protein ligase ZBED1 isoform X3 n=1 Tax=Myxocyprinus asiaticus TaxID=70543 RepID=UPI002223D65B|nr:E3 SUMO-protein ligase ZBED1 isoform X3 [Myxocyprinus asiaticus]